MQIGHTYTLPVLERRQDALILDGGELGPVPLPAKEAGTADVGDKLDAFLYTDTQGKPLATTRQPVAECGQCASLKVMDITNAGAFLDWGLEKNLLLPFAEQRRPLEVGQTREHSRVSGQQRPAGGQQSH